MKHLKIVPSFDAFAEDAKVGVVYYHNSVNVYYWLNLNTIWGYIGYNPNTGTFRYNNIPYSVIPSVPDPEDLVTPVVVNSGSLAPGITEVLFQYSDFNIFPLAYFSSSIKTIVQCNNKYSLDTIRVDNRATIELIDFDLSQIKTIRDNSSLYRSASLTIHMNDTNNTFDAGNLEIPASYKPYLGVFFEKDATTWSEDLVFSNIDDNIEKLYNWGQSNIKIFVPNVDTVEVALRKNNDCIIPFYYLYYIEDGSTIIYDGKKSNGEMASSDAFFESFYNKSNSRPYFGNIVYRNITDYGLYYKRYLQSDNYMPIPSDIIEYCKHDFLDLYDDNNVSDGDWSTVSKAQYDLTGVKHFCYYLLKFNSVTATESTIIRSYDDIVNKGIGRFSSSYTGDNCNIVSTPKLSNVNLETFGAISNNRVHTYINTDDDRIDIESIIADYMYLYMGAADIHVKKAKYFNKRTGELHDTSSVIYLMNIDGSLEKGTFYVDPCEDRTGVITIDTWMGSAITGRMRISIAGCTGKENPTALDYYNANVNTGSMFWKSGYMFDCFDIYILRDGVGSNISTQSFPLNKLKCLYRGGDFQKYTNLRTAEDMAYLVSTVPPIAANGATFDFTQAQYDLLTQSQIDYLHTELGYNIIIHGQN